MNRHLSKGESVEKRIDCNNIIYVIHTTHVYNIILLYNTCFNVFSGSTSAVLLFVRFDQSFLSKPAYRHDLIQSNAISDPPGGLQYNTVQSTCTVFSRGKLMFFGQTNRYILYKTIQNKSNTYTTNDTQAWKASMPEQEGLRASEEGCPPPPLHPHAQARAG